MTLIEAPKSFLSSHRSEARIARRRHLLVPPPPRLGLRAVLVSSRRLGAVCRFSGERNWLMACAKTWALGQLETKYMRPVLGRVAELLDHPLLGARALVFALHQQLGKFNPGL